MSLSDILYLLISSGAILLTQIGILYFLKTISYNDTERYKQTRLFIGIFIGILIFVSSIYLQNSVYISSKDIALTCFIFATAIFVLIICEMIMRNLPENNKFLNFIKKINVFSITEIFYEQDMSGNFVLKKGSKSLKPALMVLIVINNIFLPLLPILEKINLLAEHHVITMVLIALNMVLYEMYLFLSTKYFDVIKPVTKAKLLLNPSEWAKEILNTYGANTIAYTNSTTTAKEEVSMTLNDLENIVRDILEGKNMLISNASNNETKAIYYNTINKNFINNKATLIIFEDLPSVKEAKKIIDLIVEQYNNELVVRTITKVENENKRIDKDINIYISTIQDLLETNIEYNQIQTIIINNYDKIIQKNSNEIYVLATTLKKVNTNHQYLLLSMVTDSLRSATRNVLLLQDFNEYQINRKNAHQTLGTQIIRGELGTIKSHKNNFNYINDLVNLAVGTNKFEVDSIEVISKTLPIINDAAKFDYIRANRNGHLTNNELNKVTNRIKINENNLFQENADKKMFFKSDDEKNIIYNLKTYSELNNGQTYLGIVASDYMLREYMIDEYLKKNTNNSYMDIIVPQTMKNDAKILIGSLLLQMLNAPVKEEIIIRRLKEYNEEVLLVDGYNKLNIVTMINQLIEKEFGIKADITNYLTESVDEFGNVEYMLNQNFKLKLPQDLYNKSKVVLSGYEQEITEQKGYEIYQKYIPGQVHLIENKVYRIEDIDELDIKVSNVQDEYLRQYKQDKEIKISNIRNEENISEIKEYSNVIIKKEIEFADVEVKTVGYYEFLNYTNLENGEYIYRSLSKKQEEKSARTYYNVRLLKLTFTPKENKESKEIKAINKEYRDKVAYTISFLLNEIFESLLDENVPYIMAKAVVENDNIINNEEVRLYRPIVDKNNDKDSIVIYIIEDLKISKGLISTIENELPRIMNIMKKYLNWYESNKEKNDTFIKKININGILQLNEVNKILPNNW